MEPLNSEYVEALTMRLYSRRGLRSFACVAICNQPCCTHLFEKKIQVLFRLIAPNLIFLRDEACEFCSAGRLGQGFPDRRADGVEAVDRCQVANAATHRHYQRFSADEAGTYS